jgi:heptosyltransferase-2
MKFQKNKIHKILVVTLSNLGDVILTLPVFQSLVSRFPNAKLHVIVGAGGREVFEGDPRIARVTLYDKKMPLGDKIRFLSALRAERYDLIVDLRYSLIGLLGGARFHNAYFSFSKKPRHQALKHLWALKGIAPASQEPFLKIGKETPLLEAPYVVAAVGSKSDIKKWPASSYAGLLDCLASEQKCQIVLIGDKHDALDTAQVKRLMKSAVIDLCGQTDFRKLCGVIQGARVLVTNDSAPLHIADALRVPTLAIFGPTDPRRYGPRLVPSAAMAHREIFCGPCEKAQCRYAHECMKELSVEQVYQKVCRILNGGDVKKNFKILVVRLDRIGDLALSLPAIGALRERFPNAFISVMTRPATAELIQGHPWIDEVIPYFYEKGGRHHGLKGNFRFLKEIIRHRFDVAFILRPAPRAHWICFFAGIPYRIGLAARISSIFLTKKIPDERALGLKHESEYSLDVIRAFGIGPVTAKKPFLPVLPNQPFDFPPTIAFHPGASCPSKRWPKERFALLGKQILAETPFRVAIVGGKEEASLGEYLKKELGEKALDLTGKLGLRELGSFLKKCRVLVSNDSGPVHIAAAVGTPTLTIFGRNQAGLSATRWKAIGAGHRVIQKDVGCVVCLAHRCTIEFECLKAVEVQEVLANLLEMVSA